MNACMACNFDHAYEMITITRICIGSCMAACMNRLRHQGDGIVLAGMVGAVHILLPSLHSKTITQ